MNNRWIVLGLLLVLSALVLSGCVEALADAPGEDDIPVAPSIAVDVPAMVLQVRDAALDLIRAEFGDQAPALDLFWAEENITPGWPDMPVPGWSEFRFTAEAWEITVGYPIVSPDQITYHVVVTNALSGFEWTGELDADGQVVGDSPSDVPVSVPDPGVARDQAMAFASQQHNLWSTDAPVPELIWIEELITPEGMMGASHFCYTAGDWTVTVSFPLVAPEATVYQVTIENEVTGFRWAGEVDAAGQVTERSVSSAEQSAPVDYAGWELYVNAQFGYTFMRPSGTIVLEGSDGSVNLSGPLVDNERWPCIAVSHYDSGFYNPPAGTDLTQWISEHVQVYDEMDTDVSVAGLPTVHLKTNASPMAYAYDEYYFIEGGRLFRIIIVHCGRQDEGLYAKFLQSFDFPAAP